MPDATWTEQLLVPLHEELAHIAKSQERVVMIAQEAVRLLERVSRQRDEMRFILEPLIESPFRQVVDEDDDDEIESRCLFCNALEELVQYSYSSGGADPVEDDTEHGVSCPVRRRREILHQGERRRA